MTMLRNPLELYISGQQYLNRKATANLPAATRFLTNAMGRSLLGTQPPGFLHRFVGGSVITPTDVRDATIEGARNLKSFWLVGVVEQYEGFIAVMEALLDPLGQHSAMWSDHVSQKLNVSPVSSLDVLAELDPHLVEEFNSTLSYQWLIYGHAVSLFESRCQEVLARPWHADLCHVPSPPVAYY